MKARILTIIITAFLSFIIITGSAHAEVSVVLNGKGNYVKTQMLFTESNGYIYYWEPVQKGISSRMMLNIEGDLIGDGRPSCAEQPFTKLPIIVWPHFNGRDHDIVCSRWDGNQWTAITPVVEGGSNDIEATVSFDLAGVPYVAFTRAADTSQLFVTAFLHEKWTKPLLISNPSIDCSDPTFIFSTDLAAVAFLTPEGIVIVYLDQLEFYDTTDIEEGPNPLPDYVPGTGTAGFGGGRPMGQ